MHVLHIISSGGMYGAEAVMLNLSKALIEAGHTSSIGVFENLPNPNLQLEAAAIQQGIPTFRIPCRGQIDSSVLQNIRGLAAQTGADIVHAHGYKADVYTWLALRQTPTPFVSTCHNWLDDNFAVRLYGRLDRFALRHFSSVIAVSEPIRHRLLASGIPEPRIHLIRNGIDLGPYTDASPALRDPIHSAPGLNVGIVARLSPEKGVDLFLRAAALVLQDQPATRFIVAGDGPDLPHLQALLQELRIADAVTLLGRRSDVPQILASLDIVVSSSRMEGLPMAILEAMASSRPIVATAVGDVPSLIRDSDTGLLVPPGDVGALSAAITRLLRDPALQRRLGHCARALIEQEFSARRMANEYLAVYHSALSASTTQAHGESR